MPGLEVIGQPGVEHPAAAREDPGVRRVVDQGVGEPPRPILGRLDEGGRSQMLQRAGLERTAEQLGQQTFAEARCR